jgi:hypothetical protein
MPHRTAKTSTLLLAVSLTAASAADQNVWDESQGSTSIGQGSLSMVLKAATATRGLREDFSGLSVVSLASALPRPCAYAPAIRRRCAARVAGGKG